MNFSIKDIEFNRGNLIYVLLAKLNEKEVEIRAMREYESNKILILVKEFQQFTPYVQKFIDNHVASMYIRGNAGIE